MFQQILIRNLKYSFRFNLINENVRCYKRHSIRHLATDKCKKPSETGKSKNGADGLLPLPIPKLEETLEVYLTSTRPLLRPEEFLKTEEITKCFQEKDGKTLQEALCKYAKGKDNWLTDMWTKYAYLMYRDSVITNLSCGVYFQRTCFLSDFDLYKYIAKSVLGALAFRERAEANALPPEKMNKKNLDMSPYTLILGTTRIPGEKCDTFELNKKSKHIVVVFRNAFYKLPLFYENSVYKLSEDEIVDQLCTITKNCTPEKPIGILSGTDRDTQACIYKHLNEDKTNKESFDCINKAIMLVCIDKYTPTKGEDTVTFDSQQFLHGGGSKVNSSNRWFNNTVQFIVNRNGSVGITYEHSVVEGGFILALAECMISNAKKKGACDTRETNAPGKIIPASKLKFNISDRVEVDLKNAAEYVDKLVAESDLKILYFKDYGKEFIKAQRVSPDSYIQLAIQLGFFLLHGCLTAQYESAHLRQFKKGRTSTIRSCSCATLTFVETFCDVCSSKEEKKKALKDAIESHSKYVQRALNFKACDRHLFALKMLAAECGLPTPDFFNDEGYKRSTRFLLATSQLASPSDIFLFYGPSSKDGYGCSYNPHSNDIIFAVSASNTNPETNACELSQCLQKALLGMKDIFSPPKKVECKATTKNGGNKEGKKNGKKSEKKA